MRIGILGGTFDPVHIGHLIVAETVREEAGLDEIWFMPAGNPPHKDGNDVTDAGTRLALLQAAIAGCPHFRISELELERGGPSYTVDTARALSARYPHNRFFWIIGGDMVAHLPRFDRVEELVAEIGLLGVARPGFEAAAESLPASLADAVTMVPVPLIALSSTDIRQRIRAGKSVRYLLPDAVINVIKERCLYGS